MKIVTINPHQPPPHRADFLAESIMEGLKKNNVEVISSAPGLHAGKVVRDEELIEHSKDADFIIVIWDKLRRDKPEPKYHLLDKINRPDVTAFVDGAEWTFNGHPYPKPKQIHDASKNPIYRRGEPWINKEINSKVKWYFKRECYPQDREEFDCIPLPFAAVDRYFKVNNSVRTHTVQCSFGQLETGLRYKVQKICVDLSNSSHIDNMLVGKLPHEQYLNAMTNSYAVVDAWGGGDCNARFYEAAANGACLIYQKYQILTPFPYIDGQGAITYSTPEEFKEKVLHYFHKNKRIDEVIKIAKRSYNNTINHHTSEKRVKYMFDVMTNKLNVDEVIG